MTLAELRKALPKGWKVFTNEEANSDGCITPPAWVARAVWPACACPTCGRLGGERVVRTDWRYRDGKEAVAALASKLEEMGVLK